MRNGFTLIELLVVIAIAGFLSTIAIVYSNEGRGQVSLAVEAVKESQLILQAKQLSIATYNQNQQTPACGYGMYFDYAKSTYSLFIYSPQTARSSGVCPTVASATASIFNPDPVGGDIAEYSAGSWRVPVTPGLKLESVDAGTGVGPSAEAVIFFPPDPRTLITNVTQNGNFTNEAAYVDIVTANNNATKTIMITPAGQVTFQ